MKEFLLFTIHAPLASWGEIAVGENRGSWSVPSKSALLGLLGAALGIDRADAESQRALTTDYRVAVRIDSSGSLLTDYHTVQTVSASLVKKHAPHTRARLMAIDDRDTLLSQRGYRQNAVYTVAIWAAHDARWSLDQIQRALREPAYVLFAGRKCNPMALPMLPELVSGETLAGAFVKRPPLPVPIERALRRYLLRRDAQWGRFVAHDACEGFSSGLASTNRRELRRDIPTDRGKAWRFENRLVEFGELPVASGVTE